MVSNRLALVTRRRWVDYLADRMVAGVLVLLVIAFTLLGRGFFTLPSWLATATQLPETLVLAVGETLVIITGGIDLSVGAVLGFSAMTSAIVMQALTNGQSPTPLIVGLGLLVAAGIGLAWGILNGILVTRIRVSPFIATLATLGMATGATFIISGGTTVTTMPGVLGTWVNASLFGIFPVIFLVALVPVLVVAFVLGKTRFGVRSYAIGSNLRSARVAGIDVGRHLIKVYAITGLLAGFDGMLLTARFVTATPFYGANDELSAIAAVIVGGASLFGGRGNMFGTFVGSLIVSIIPTGLIVMGLSAYWQMVGVGAVIILAVFLDQLRHRGRAAQL